MNDATLWESKAGSKITQYFNNLCCEVQNQLHDVVTVLKLTVVIVLELRITYGIVVDFQWLKEFVQ